MVSFCEKSSGCAGAYAERLSSLFAYIETFHNFCNFEFTGFYSIRNICPQTHKKLQHKLEEGTPHTDTHRMNMSLQLILLKQKEHACTCGLTYKHKHCLKTCDHTEFKCTRDTQSIFYVAV